nr:hypothetical protein [uncultured Duganella sp.]
MNRQTVITKYQLHELRKSALHLLARHPSQRRCSFDIPLEYGRQKASAGTTLANQQKSSVNGLLRNTLIKTLASAPKPELLDLNPIHIALNFISI